MKKISSFSAPCMPIHCAEKRFISEYFWCLWVLWLSSLQSKCRKSRNIKNSNGFRWCTAKAAASSWFAKQTTYSEKITSFLILCSRILSPLSQKILKAVWYIVPTGLFLPALGLGIIWFLHFCKRLCLFSPYWKPFAVHHWHSYGG